MHAISDLDNHSGDALVQRPAPHQTSTSIYIVEDHAVMRESLRTLLEGAPGLEVCGEACTGAVALEEIGSIDADLVLVDVSLPDMSGIELARELRRLDPSVTVAMLSGHVEHSYVAQAFDAGALGYILKGRSAEVPEAIRQLMSGERYVSARLGDLV